MQPGRSKFLLIWTLAPLATLASSHATRAQVKELAGHKEAVAAVAFSPDGKTVATGSFDKTIKLWDAAAQKEVRALDGHAGMVLTVTFTKDGTKLLSGGEDNLVKLWNLAAAAQQPKALPASPAPIKALAATKDGKLLAGACEDGNVRLYDVASLMPVRDFGGHGGPVFAAVFSPDGARLYTAAADRSVRVFETGSGKPLASQEIGSQPATSLALLPKEDGFVVGKSTGQVERFPLPLPELKTLAGHDGEILKVKVHPQGNVILSSGSDKSVRVHDVASGMLQRAIPTTVVANDFAISPADPNLLATVGDDKAVRLWNLADGKPVAAKENLANPASAVAFAPDGKTIFVGEADGTVRAHGYPFVAELASRAAPAHDGPIQALARAADGSLLLTAGDDKIARLWGPAGEPIRAFALFAPIKAAALSPDKQLVAAVGAGGEMRVWNINGQELKVLSGMAGPVAFSADGKQLAVAGADNKVYLHPSALDAEPKAIAAHASPVRAIAFTPAGNAVLSAGGDKVVKVSDVAMAKEVASLAGHQGAILSLAVAPDGKTAYSGGEDKNVLVWDLAAGKSTATLGGAGGPVTSIAVSGDGARVAAASADNNLRVYQGGALVSTLANPAPVGVVFLSDNVGLAAASADKQLYFHAFNPPRVAGKHDKKVTSLAVTPDGKLLVSGGEDHQVRVWDAASGAAARAMAHQAPVASIAVSSDGMKVASGSADKTCKLWNLADGKELLSLGATNAVTDVALSKDNQKVAYASSDNLARVHGVAGPELATFTIGNLRGVAFVDDATAVMGSADKSLRVAKVNKAWIQQHGGPVTAVVASADGAKVVSASADNTVVVRNAADGAAVKPIQTPSPTSLAMAGDNVRLAVGSADKILKLFDANAGSGIQSYPASETEVLSVAISADGKLLGSVEANGSISLWSGPVDKTAGALLSKTPTSAPGTACAYVAGTTFAGVGGDKTIRLLDPPPPPVLNLAGHTGQVYGVAVAPDNKTAASASADNKIILWDLEAQKAVKTLEGHKAQVYTVAFSPDGKLLASGSGDKTVLLWDLAMGKPVHTLAGAADAIYQVAFTPDGKFLLAGGVDKTPRMWEVASGKEVKTFSGQPDEVYGLKISPSGKRFATTGYTGSVIVWDLESGKQLHQQKLSFGAFDVSYLPAGTQLVVANNDKKAYLVDIPEAAR